MPAPARYPAAHSRSGFVLDGTEDFSRSLAAGYAMEKSNMQYTAENLCSEIAERERCAPWPVASKSQPATGFRPADCSWRYRTRSDLVAE